MTSCDKTINVLHLSCSWCHGWRQWDVFPSCMWASVKPPVCSGPQTESCLPSRLFEANCVSPRFLISLRRKRSMDAAVYQNAHSYMHIRNEQTSKLRNEKTHTHTHRSFSTSQGQRHTSAWIITLSHSSSRLWITSRRPLGRVGVRWGAAEEKTEHTNSVQLGCVFCKSKAVLWMCVWTSACNVASCSS